MWRRGIPIPIKVTGPWSSLSYKIEWNNVFKSIDPQRLKSLPGDLGKAAKSFGVEIPGGLPGASQAPSGGTQQPAQQQKKPEQLLKGLLGR